MHTIRADCKICPFGVHPRGNGFLVQNNEPRFARIQWKAAVKQPVSSKGGACICLLIPVRRKGPLAGTFRSLDASARSEVRLFDQKPRFLIETEQIAKSALLVRHQTGIPGFRSKGRGGL